MKNKSEHYVPALSFSWLTPFYDPLIRLTMPERAFKLKLIEQARITAGSRVLDLGCGTATLTILIKRLNPTAVVHGLDGDARILKMSRAKASSANASILLEEGMSYALPYRDESFDRVLSSLFFHHLTPENKRRTLEEVHRVLRPRGELHVGDFGRPQNLLMRALSIPWQVFDGRSRTRDNIEGRLPEFFRDAGFSGICETARFMTLFGTLSLYRARKL